MLIYLYLFMAAVMLQGQRWIFANKLLFSQVSCSVVSNSLWCHRLQYARLPCPSPTPRVCSNSCASSWWCHPNILSSVVPFSTCLQSFPASGSFQMSQLFVSGSQKYWSFSFSISPSSEYSGLISFWIDCFDFLAVQGTFKSLLQTTVQKYKFFCAQLSL